MQSLLGKDLREEIVSQFNLRPHRGIKTGKINALNHLRAILHVFVNYDMPIGKAAKFIGWDIRTFQRLIKRNQSFSDLYSDAKLVKWEKTQEDIVEAARRGLKLSAGGHMKTVRQREIVSLGDGKEKIGKVTEKEVWIAPNPYAIQQALTNLDSDNFKTNPDNIPSGDKSDDLPLIEWVD